MGKTTAIGWTDHTFNPWLGCQRVSPACGDAKASCYAEWFAANRMGYRDDGAKGFHLWGPTKGENPAQRVRTSNAYWKQPLTWNRQAETSGVRRKVFCASMADVFEAPSGAAGSDLEEWRADLWPLIAATPWLDWLLLTKRPENILGMIPFHWREEGLPDNVWAGTTVENQEYAEKRVRELLRVPAATRWLSIEPMLGAVDARRFLDPDAASIEEIKTWPCDDCGATHDCDCEAGPARIRWVVVGGQSGPGHHALNLDSARSLIAQCRETDTPVFVKQDSGALAGQQGRFTAAEWALKQWPPSVRQMPEVRR